MNKDKLKNILEAALMSAHEPLGVNQLLAMFDGDLEKPDKAELRAALDEIQKDYGGRGIELKEVASGFRFQVRSEFAEWINRLQEDKPQRYSRALLETLAIIAYRQPVTRGEIEEIRGVSISHSIIKTLQEREWIRVVGHRDVPGKPELLATTRQFLDYFNLKKLSDLPPLSAIKDFDKINPDLFEQLENKLGPEQKQEQDPTEKLRDGQNDDVVEDNVVPFSG